MALPSAPYRRRDQGFQRRVKRGRGHTGLRDDGRDEVMRRDVERGIVRPDALRRDRSIADPPDLFRVALLDAIYYNPVSK
jgi:hypothetical protein